MPPLRWDTTSWCFPTERSRPRVVGLRFLPTIWGWLIWFIYGFYMVYIWCIYIYMVYIWYTWFICGLYMVYIWFIHVHTTHKNGDFGDSFKLNPIINHPQNHHKWVVWSINHLQTIGSLLGCPHVMDYIGLIYAYLGFINYKPLTMPGVQIQVDWPRFFVIFWGWIWAGCVYIYICVCIYVCIYIYKL